MVYERLILVTFSPLHGTSVSPYNLLALLYHPITVLQRKTHMSLVFRSVNPERFRGPPICYTILGVSAKGVP